MAIIKIINSRASIANVLNYVMQKEKTDERLVSGVNCVPRSSIFEMKATKQYYGKTNGRQYAHIVQSFDPNDNITPEQAHEIGERFINETEKFNGFEVVIATHRDREHIHNHFVINSVNFDDGKKLHTTKYELEALKVKNVELCEEHGLSIPIKGEDFTSNNQAKYFTIKKGFEKKVKSYVLDTGKTVIDSLRQAESKVEFIELMNIKGYEVNWTDKRKYVVFMDIDGNKVRNSNLAKTFKEGEIFTKEGMMHEIERSRDNGARADREREDSANSKREPEGNSRVEQDAEKLYNSSDGQGFNKESVTGQGTGGNRENKRDGAREDDFNISQARDYAEKLRRDITEEYGGWSARDESKHRSSIERDDEYRDDAGKQDEQHEIENDRKHVRNEYGYEK